MVNEAFDDIKQAKAHQHGPGQQLAGPAHVRPMRRPPQQEEAEQDKEIRAQVKKAVPQRIDLKVLHAVGRIAGTGEHVVPLEHLMQQNPIEESPEAQPEQQTGSDRKVALLTRRAVHGFSFSIGIANES